MKKKLAWLSWLTLSAVSPLACAVGLGQVTVNSPLQAPLNATVPLIDTDGFVLEDLRVEMAEQAAFNALGLAWTPLVDSVRAELQSSSSGPRLVLSSSQAINEPWLDLLVTISSPEGQQTRALTLLFDPPEYAMQRDAASASGARQPALQAQPVPPEERTQPVERGVAYVASGDTLWGVAARVKPADVSTQQMMVALVEANPTTFPTGNVDNMRAGQTLSVPSRQQVMSLTPSEAAQMIQTMRQPATNQVSAPPAESEEQSSVEPSEKPDNKEPDNKEPASSESQNSPESVAVVEQGPLSGLTLNDLAEQLIESQAMLQTVIEEREQMRAELTALRQEVASLTQALNASQRVVQAVEVADSGALTANAAASEAVGAQGSSGIVEHLRNYQWPLASSVLALLLGALIWSRKRRERQWEEVSETVSVQDRAPTPHRSMPDIDESRAGQYTPPVSEAAKSEPALSEFTQLNAERASDDSESSNFSNEQEVPSASAEEQSFSIEEKRYTVNDEPSENIKVDEDDEEALNAAFLHTPEPVGKAVSHSSSALEEAHKAALAPTAEEDDHRAHYIDYHPPSLPNSEESADEQLAEGAHLARTPDMQTASQPRQATEEEWEIEEVAFEPRRRDNS